MKKRNALWAMMFVAIAIAALGCSKKQASPVTEEGALQPEAQSAAPAGKADYDTLASFLVDQSGWTAEKAEEMKMAMGPMKVHNAVREYQKGDAEITATLMVGGTAMAAGLPGQMSFEAGDAAAQVKKIDGFSVRMGWDKAEQEGAVSVEIVPNAQKGVVFALSFEHMTLDEALAFAKRFDWKAMREKAASL